MTDERIKEEFDKWYDGESLCTDEERRFYEQYPSFVQPVSTGFYSGFRAAERLAKIEVLEELAEWIWEDTFGHTPTEIHIQEMLKALKEGK